MNIYCHLPTPNRWLKVKSAVDVTCVHENALRLSVASYSGLLITVGTESPEVKQPAIYFYNGQSIEAHEAFYVEV